MFKYIFFLVWIFTFNADAQNVVSVHLEDVFCQLDSYNLLICTYDSVENRIRLYDDSIYDHFPRGCTLGWDEARCEKWNSDHERLVREQELVWANASLMIDSLNNEVKNELKSISEQYCLLNKIDLFLTSDEPPLFGITPKDVSEEFAAYILSLK
ncbi:hypothetical protein [Fluviicola chungangensis]|uniref:DUF1311 domain-containing protein n=1 Tax=Fluviicola chungangensis TaxID=2597671 RepID=A0A556N5X3_9FLAO|nr:hypothetical protein [Fluviicola chungangensis]TSJ47590.1 hypothetical protein FO442_00235 [Fluviicola chungangensis]